jgi:hypothetical protein
MEKVIINNNNKKKKASNKTAKNRRKRQRRSLVRRQSTDANLPLNAPLSLGTRNRPTPYISSGVPSKPGSEFRVIGCDYIGSVTSSATEFNDNTYDVIPINATTFPRLSAVASVFGKYSYNKLEFIVVGKAASTVPGDMTSVFSYGDSSAGLTEAQLKNRVGQVTSKFWENHYAACDPKKATVPWYINYNNPNPTQCFGFYHLGTESTGSTIGAIPVADIWFCYDVEFCEAVEVGDGDT